MFWFNDKSFKDIPERTLDNVNTEIRFKEFLNKKRCSSLWNIRIQSQIHWKSSSFTLFAHRAYSVLWRIKWSQNYEKRNLHTHYLGLKKEDLKEQFHSIYLLEKWISRGLNPGPSECKSDVIPLHHWPLMFFFSPTILNILTGRFTAISYIIIILCYLFHWILNSKIS